MAKSLLLSLLILTPLRIDKSGKGLITEQSGSSFGIVVPVAIILDNVFYVSAGGYCKPINDYKGAVVKVNGVDSFLRYSGGIMVSLLSILRLRLRLSSFEPQKKKP